MLNAVGLPLIFGIENVRERNDAIMKAAYLYDVPVYCYRISDISEYIVNGKMRAVRWCGGEYREFEIECPKYTEFYCSTTEIRAKFPTEFRWLFNHTCITDHIGLGKLDFQRRLLLSHLTQYAIPTALIHSYDELICSASVFPVSFLKPANGRKAKGAMKLESVDGKVLYSTPEGRGELTREIFTKYYTDYGYSENSKLLLEPCLNILNDEGRAVDFRCLVSLNGEGKWQNVLTYARIGGSGVASNFSHGGSLNFAEDVLEMLIPGHGAEKLEEINRVALQVAEFVQKESPNPVSWLGLDICVDRPSNQVYVIEANSKPGTKLVGPWPLSLVRAQYFKYLLSQSKEE